MVSPSRAGAPSARSSEVVVPLCAAFRSQGAERETYHAGEDAGQATNVIDRAASNMRSLTLTAPRGEASLRAVSMSRHIFPPRPMKELRRKGCVTIDAICNLSGLLQISLPAYSDHLRTFPERERRWAGAFLPWNGRFQDVGHGTNQFAPYRARRSILKARLSAQFPSPGELRRRLDHRSLALALVAPRIGRGEAGQFPLQ